MDKEFLSIFVGIFLNGVQVCRQRCSAVKVLGDETLHQIAKELVEAVRKNATIDWTVKESARAKLRVVDSYPPDKQEKATQKVLKQAELLCKEWAC
jgi:type I restriction enzyme R subunit